MKNKQEKDWYESVRYAIEVVKAGFCRAYHKVGQQYIIDEYTTPSGLCIEVFHSMYPLLFAGRIMGDFTILGSSEENERVFTCPSRVVQFRIKRSFHCNNCGKVVQKEEYQKIKKSYGELILDILVCEDCYIKLNNT